MATTSQYTHKIAPGTSVRVYDYGDSVSDRYTVIMVGKDWDASARRGYKMSLGMSEGGRAVSQWGEAQEGRHLGKRVKWEDLSADTRRHIESRVGPTDEMLKKARHKGMGYLRANARTTPNATPSVKTIIDGFGDYLRHEGADVEHQAKEIKKALVKAESERDPDIALGFVNDVLKGHGVEAISEETISL